MTVPSRPAANKRSPNRKPRTKSVVRARVRESEREMFLRVYLAAPLDQDAYAYACGAIGKSKAQINYWVQAEKSHGYSEFMAEWSRIKGVRQRLMETRREELNSPALGVVEATLADEDKKLRFEAAKEQLRGSGFWGQRHELTGKDGEPIKIQTIEVILDASDTR